MRFHRACITSIVTFGVLLITTFLYNSVYAGVADVCTVRQTSNGWTLNPDEQTITGSFVVSGGLGCNSTDVSVMSWKADTSQLPNDSFWNNQTVNDVQTQNLKQGTHSITVQLPKCSGYQADVIAAGDPSPNLKPPGQGSYYDAKQANGSSIVVASAIGNSGCSTSTTTTTTTPNTPPKTTDKPKPTTTPTPTPVPIPTPSPPTNTFTPNTTVVPTPTTTIVLASAVKPTSLPNTGPGTTVGLFVLVSVAAGLVHHRYHHRKHRLAELAGALYSPTIHHPQQHIHHHQDHNVSHADQHQQIHEHSQPLEHVQHENNQQNPNNHQ